MSFSQKDNIINNINPDFEPINYEDEKNENTILEILKNEQWESIVPQIIEAIDYCKDDQSYGDYPYFRIQNTIKFIPETNIPSEIFNNNQLMELHSRLPYYHQYSNLRLIYSIAKDGCLMKTFYQKVSGENNLIFAVKDDDNNIFGEYSSEEFNNSGKCFLELVTVFYILFIKKIGFMFIMLLELMSIIYMEMIIKLHLDVLMIIFH